MFKPVVAVIMVLFLLLSATASAQQKRPAYGPVVRAFLTGLDEELTELEFQFQHKEISRAIYDRTKQRLAILRRYVQRIASSSREDRVPELQVLAEDELGILLPDGDLNIEELKTGDELGEQWKLVSIERNRTRFFVLEKLPKFESSGVIPERKLSGGVDIRDAIETIVIHEEVAEPEPAPQKTVEAQPAVTTTGPVVDKAPPALVKPEPQNLKLLHIYLPEYTGKAREKKIEGELIVRAMFQADGKIKDVKVEKGLGYGLDNRAVEAVKRLGFLPAELNGQAVDSSAQIVFNFKLEKVTIYVGSAEFADKSKL